MSAPLAELMTKEQGMVVARGAGQPGYEQPLADGHPFKIHGIVVLDDGGNPMNGLQPVTGVIVSGLSEIDYGPGKEGVGENKANGQKGTESHEPRHSVDRIKTIRPK